MPGRDGAPMMRSTRGAVQSEGAAAASGPTRAPAVSVASNATMRSRGRRSVTFIGGHPPVPVRGGTTILSWSGGDNHHRKSAPHGRRPRAAGGLGTLGGLEAGGSPRRWSTEVAGMQVGIYTFAEVSPDPVTGRPADPARRLAELVEEIELADRVGLDVFGV